MYYTQYASILLFLCATPYLHAMELPDIHDSLDKKGALDYVDKNLDSFKTMQEVQNYYEDMIPHGSLLNDVVGDLERDSLLEALLKKEDTSSQRGEALGYALIAAAGSANEDAVRKLLDNGARFSKKRENGAMPIEVLTDEEGNSCLMAAVSGEVSYHRSNILVNIFASLGARELINYRKPVYYPFCTPWGIPIPRRYEMNNALAMVPREIGEHAECTYVGHRCKETKCRNKVVKMMREMLLEHGEQPRSLERKEVWLRVQYLEKTVAEYFDLLSADESRFKSLPLDIQLKIAYRAAGGNDQEIKDRPWLLDEVKKKREEIGKKKDNN